VTAVEGTGPVRRPPFAVSGHVGERGSQTERRILEAALGVFGEVGYAHTRVELITDRAGCSRPSFYQYFASKDDVFWKLGRELGGKMDALGTELGPIGPDADGLAALAVWIDEFMTVYLAYAPVFSAFQAASRDHEELAATSATFGARLDSALLRAFERPDRPEELALASGMAAVLIRCSFYWSVRAASGGRDRRRLVDGVAHAIHRLFHGPIEGVNIERGSAPARNRPILPPAFDPLPAPPGQRPLRARGVEARRRLLDAGVEVLPARGFHATRVDDIVATAGVSHGSFYRYFADKDDFFRALAWETSAPMLELLGRFPASGTEAELHQWLDEWFDGYERNGGVISTWQEMQDTGAELTEVSQQVAASVTTGLVAMLRQRGFGDPVIDALILLALLERLPYRAFVLGFTSRDAAIDAASTIVRQALMAQPRTRSRRAGGGPPATG
jgi:AcrR family transcriptional regulator